MKKNKSFLDKIKNIAYHTYMCIKYPFLYPRNRWDGKHHAYILEKQISKVREEAFQIYAVNIKLERKEDKSYSKFLYINEFGINVELTETILSHNTSIYNIFIYNEYDSKEIWLQDTFGIDYEKFEILGLSKSETFFKNPIINIHIRLKDENDNTNYGFTNHTVNLIKNKFYYNLYKIAKWVDEKILDNIFILPIHNEWDAVEPGWNKAFGKQYLDELKKQLKKDKLLYKFRITQIKEKWGKFQLYCYNGSNKVHDIINKYEQLSWDYCKCCGKPAEVISTGWISPYCKECAEKYNLKYVEKNKKNNNI